jgi:Domain of unknown function (DUF4062)
MRQLSIFVSSTCYDLKSLREHIRRDIASWGHDPVLSEYPSFPVSPDLSTVENCKKVVKDRADIFVLVVGGKRGSLDPKTASSVVNSEYREARAAGLDCIVFVDKQVWDLLPIYRNNRNIDFAPTVDSTTVFGFLEELIADTRWIYPFTKTEDILSTLRVQLSTRFQDLLLRSRQNRLVTPNSFANEPQHIARIALDKGDRWEFYLACELMRDRINRLDAKFGELNAGFVVRRTKFLAARDTINFIQDLLTDFTNALEAAARVLSEQLTPAFGPPGTSGDADKIKAACDNLYGLFLSLYDWELDVRFVRPHEAFEDIFPQMQGWTSEMLEEFRRIPVEFDRLLADDELSGKHSIRLTLNAPSNLDALGKTIQRMTNDPRVMEALSGG